MFFYRLFREPFLLPVPLWINLSERICSKVQTLVISCSLPRAKDSWTLKFRF